MKNVYVYFFRSSYTDEFISTMEFLLTCMAKSGTISTLTTVTRYDLDAVEILCGGVSDKAMDALKFLSECDMGYVTSERLTAD